MLAFFGGYTADLSCVKVDFDNVAGKSRLFVAFCLVDRQVCVGIVNFVYNIHTDINSDCSFIGIYVAENNILVVVVSFDCRDYRAFDSFAEKFK